MCQKVANILENLNQGHSKTLLRNHFVYAFLKFSVNSWFHELSRNASYQVVPFLVVVLSTLKEACRDEEDTPVEVRSPESQLKRRLLKGTLLKKKLLLVLLRWR